MAFDRPPNSLEWGRFHEFARHIKYIVFNLVQHQPFLHQLANHLPPGPLFPNLRHFCWDSSTENTHPPPSLFLSHSVTCIEIRLSNNTNPVVLFRNLVGTNCNPHTLQIHLLDDAPDDTPQQLPYLLHRLQWSHLTSIDIRNFIIQVPSDTNILSSLSHLQSLTICHLFIETKGDMEYIKEAASELPYGFLYIKEFHIGWDSSQSSYYFVKHLILSIISGDLDTITLHLPLSSHSSLLPSDWIGDIFDALSTHSIRHLLIDYCHLNPISRTSKPFIQGFLQPHSI